MTPARRRSLAVGGLLGLAVALVALVALRTLNSDAPADAGPDAVLTAPGAVQAGGIPTQVDITGASLPTGDLERLDGGTLRFAALQGRPVVVNFWAEWCEPCQREMPAFQSVYRSMGDRIEFVGVNLRDGADTARSVAEQTGVTYPLVRDPDGSVAAALQLVRMPTTLFIGPDGSVVGQHAGELSGDELTAEIERLFPA